MPVLAAGFRGVRPGSDRPAKVRQLLTGDPAPGLLAYLDGTVVGWCGLARVSTAFAYVGTTSMFEAAGFHRVVQTAAHSASLPRWLMRRTFWAAACCGEICQSMGNVHRSDDRELLERGATGGA